MDRLDELFLAQLDLVHKVSSVYSQNGFDAWTKAPDMDDRVHQAHVKYVAWCFVEELVEAADAPEDKLLEEVADAFHFLLELMIFCNVTPAELYRRTMKSTGDHHVETLDRLDYLFFRAGVTHVADGMVPLERVIVAAGRAMYELKQKPWRVTTRETDIERLRNSLGVLFHAFILFAITKGITAKQLYLAYFHKNNVNHNRVQEKY